MTPTPFCIGVAVRVASYCLLALRGVLVGNDFREATFVEVMIDAQLNERFLGKSLSYSYCLIDCVQTS
jgi:hypothetical protein